MDIQELHIKHYHSLENDALLLRALNLDDAEAMSSYTSRKESFLFLKREAHHSVNETRLFLEKVVNAYHMHNDFIWGICDKEQNRLVGTCRLFDLDIEDLRGEVSYMVHPDFRRRGIAYKAIDTLIRYAFKELGLQRVQARCVAENVGSERVMQKCGMQFEGILRQYAKIHGQWKNFKLYAIVEENS